MKFRELHLENEGSLEDISSGERGEGEKRGKRKASEKREERNWNSVKNKEHTVREERKRF